ncbi:pectate lyase [Pseudoxanthomonas sp. 3HH-4]|uniref:pectate lyase family protein n=1 Tax=Pseudoxanthomonas sp. 3HH-4 TaxID=1690214 RepID=UPI0011539443|nr:pectate lyase [Pseudoxanthomonas sp. 3HH-4]TQM17271.1 pectate lyase [Pseudoxanthomonas sp. 3HH-4]
MLHICFPARAFGLTCGLAALLMASAMTPALAADAPALAFPGAQGAAAHTPGGRGGKIVRVTTLAAEGPGSFKEAVTAKGPRIVVFEVGGVIDLGMKELRISEPFLTIAGQTAPHPGVTIIKGGLTIATHDVVIRHLRIRPGDGGLPKRSGDIDAITTVRGAHDVIVDHCSLTWATDENLSASSTRFHGENEAEWMANASRRITYSNNIVGEGLANSIHAKGEHSKGSLIHDHVNEVLIVGNLYAHNYERSPLFKGGARGQVINNLIYNPGQRAIHYNLIAEEWLGHPYSKGEMVVRGNVMRAGKSTEPLAFLMIGGSGDLDLYAQDNLIVDRVGNKSIQETGSYTTAPVKLNRVKQAPALPFGVTPRGSGEVQDAVIETAGATPWNRDLIDRRIVADVIEGRGEIIDSQEQVGGYPHYKEARKPFVESEWNLDVMEPIAGYPRGEPLR